MPKRHESAKKRRQAGLRRHDKHMSWHDMIPPDTKPELWMTPADKRELDAMLVRYLFHQSEDKGVARD